MIAIGFCGCCGSWFQSKCLLVSYLSLIVTIMLLEIAAGSLGYVFRAHIRQTLHQELLDGVKIKYNINDTNGMMSTWDTAQISFNCCGVDGYNDWYNISAWPEQQWVPASCCLPANSTSSSLEWEVDSDGKNVTVSSASSPEDVCGRDAERDSGRYRQHGCFKKIRHWIMEHLHVVGLTCIIFAFIQFFSIVSALLVVCTMDYKRRSRPSRGSSRPTYNRVPTL